MGKAESDRKARASIANDATMAISESQLLEMQAAAAAKAAAPPIPGSVTSPPARSVPPNDASMWGGKIMLADELMPKARAKRQRRWPLVAVLAVAALAAG